MLQTYAPRPEYERYTCQACGMPIRPGCPSRCAQRNEIAWSPDADPEVVHAVLEAIAIVQARQEVPSDEPGQLAPVGTRVRRPYDTALDTPMAALAY